jgi:hypothetical protein
MVISNMQICPRCHAIIQPVVVHGHYQCQICKSNIDDCCSGEICQSSIEMSTLKEEENNFKISWRLTCTQV